MKIEEATFNPSQGWSLARSAKATKRGKFRALGPIQGGGVAKPPGPRGKELISAGLAELARVASSPKPAPKPDQAATPVEEFIRVVQFNRSSFNPRPWSQIANDALGAGVGRQLVKALACYAPRSDIARRAEQRLVFSITKDIDLAASFGRPEER